MIYTLLLLSFLFLKANHSGENTDIQLLNSKFSQIKSHETKLFMHHMKIPKIRKDTQVTNKKSLSHV